MGLRLLRTDSKNDDFVVLVTALDADLAIRDGADHAFYAQFNKVDHLRHVVVAYLDEQAVGCGAMKAHHTDAMEIKRMYTLSEFRGKGIASRILNELENWASTFNIERCVLETGVRQPEAIALYQKCGYHRIPNYGQYANVQDSLCFEKRLH